jgi:hypothetical protein
MSHIKALRMLTGVRERQGERIKETLQQQRDLLQDLHDKVEQANEASLQRSLDEQTLQNELSEILRKGFTPERRIALDYAMQDAATARQQAAAAVQMAEQAVQKQEVVIKGLETDQRRNQQRIDSLTEQIRSIKAREELAIEDAAEEEAEETASARFCRIQRAPVAH